MTVVGLHPEELFDKLVEGEITPVERQRLSAHLEACEVCRFEYATRVDFQEEALSLAAMSAPPVVPLRIPQPLAKAAAPLPKRRRPRLLVWGLAAAALITASGALASALAGEAPWRAMSRLFSPSKPPLEQPQKKPSNALGREVSPCERADCDANTAAAAAVEAVAAPATDAESRVASTAPRELGPRVPALRSVKSRAGSAVVVASVASERAEAPRGEPPLVEPPTKETPSAAKLFGDANQARRAGDIGRAVGLYHLLQEQYPGSAEAELSRVTLALLLLDGGDARGALAGFERYLAGGSRGLEAEALVGRARALGRLGRRDLETTAWREVQRKFPRSIYGRQATERLAALGQP
jgi:TolA-binding protein